MPGQFLQPDHSRGDANTIGGYMRVHARPAAFDGSDGMSYSVAIEVDRVEGAPVANDPANGPTDRAFGAWFLFLRWRRIGPQGVEGHLETDYLAWGPTPAAARESLGAWSLADTRQALEAAIRAHREAAPPTDSSRRWWDAMRDDDDVTDEP